MRSNSEIRESAWRLLWQGKWFWRLLGGTILLNVCTQFIMSFLNSMLDGLGVFGVTALANALSEHARTRAPLPEFTPDLIMQFASSTALILFFALIMGGISAYGNSALLLRTADENEEGWLKAAFGGFKRPLGLAWLSFRIFLIYLFWFLVSLVPAAALVGLVVVSLPPVSASGSGGPVVYALSAVAASSLVVAILCVPFYRYRYLFRIKADHPDWNAGQCLRECAATTNGFKWRCFVHDCSYWKILLAPLLFLLLCVAVVCALSSVKYWCPEGARVAVLALGALIGISLYLALLVLAVVAGYYIGVGQTLLYRDVSRTEPEPLRDQAES